MKLKALDILWLFPSVVMSAYFVTQNYWFSLMWGNFFQTRNSFKIYFMFAHCFFLWLLVIIVICFCVTVRLLNHLLSKKWAVLRKDVLELFAIALIPIAGMYYSNLFTDPYVIHKALKSSFEKTDIDLRIVQQWVNTLDPENAKGFNPIVSPNIYNRWTISKNLPEDIQQIISTLRPSYGTLEVSSENRVYVNFQFQSFFLDIGIVVGTHFKATPLSTDEDFTSIVLSDNAFIWLDN